MKSVIFASLSIAALLPSAMGCTSALFGTGTCQYPVQKVSGHGDKLSADLVNQLADCFKAKYGPGPYTFDGVDIPDSSSQGNAWAVQMGTFQLSVGNSCGCSESMDANVFNDLAGAAEGQLTVKLICGQGDQCPQVTGADGTKLPANVYAAAENCDIYCSDGGYNKFETC